MPFEDLSTSNADALEEDLASEKRAKRSTKAKAAQDTHAPTITPPQPQFKPTKAMTQQVENLLNKPNTKDEKARFAAIRQNRQYRSQFPSETNSYPRLREDSDLATIVLQNTEMAESIANADQIPNGHQHVKSFLLMLDKATSGLIRTSTGWKVHSWGLRAAQDEDVYKKYFERPATALIIKYDLFRSGPEWQMAYAIYQCMTDVHSMSSRSEQERHCTDNQARYEDL
jgi:hypothetical protein